MKYRSRAILAVMILIASTLACNVPGSSQPLSVDDQAATAIALTLHAQTPTRDVSNTRTASATPRSTSTSAGPATATITPTFSTPMLTVQEQTNCREGPG